MELETEGQESTVQQSEVQETQQETQQSESSTETQQEAAKPVEEELIPRKRLDKIVWQREEARREAEHWKRMAQQNKPPEQTAVQEDPGKPRIEQFDSFEKYTEALTEWKVETRIKKAQEEYNRNAQAERIRESLKGFNERADKVREKYPDYDELFERASISEAMAPTILESDQGPELVVYLSRNPDVARKLYGMGPTQAARELGKIEAKLDDLMQTKVVSDAKPPLKPVKPKGDIPTGLDDSLDIKEWMKRRNKQLGR